MGRNKGYNLVQIQSVEYQPVVYNSGQTVSSNPQGQVDTNMQLYIDRNKIDINSNVVASTESIIPTINNNTDSQVSTIITTPVSGYVTLTQGSVFQTVYSRNGSGVLYFLSFIFGNIVSDFGIKITIDGTVYILKTFSGSPILYGILQVSTVYGGTYPYTIGGATGISGISSILNIPYKSSILIEAYSNEGSSSSRVINYLISNNI